MTDTHPESPHPVASVIHLGSSYGVLSIDLTEYGALIVTMEGRVQLLPWHTINGIEFYDDSPFQPQVAAPVDDGLPKGHEGSE